MASEERPDGRVRRAGTALRFATIAVDKGGCRTRVEPNFRATFQRVTALGGWRDRAGRDEPVELTNPALTVGNGGDQLRYNAPMGSDDDTLTLFDPPNVSAEVVLQFAYASLHI